ncbi:MAG: hypothetical protein ABI068_14070, partial [Ktedonobacterales bacterium]
FARVFGSSVGRKRGALGILFACALLAALIWALHSLSNMPTQPTTHGGAVDLTVSVNPANTTYAVSPHFLGFGMETGDVCKLIDLAHQNPALLRLFTNLGPGTLRVGGNTLDTTTWAPDGAGHCSSFATTMTQATVDAFFAFAQRAGWKVTWGLTLKHYDPTLYAAEGAYILQRWRDKVLSLEYGNEPDLYHIPYAKFLAEWRSYNDLIQTTNPQTTISGPATAGSGWITPFLSDEGAHAALVSSHFYITCATTHPTIADLLSAASISREVSSFDAVAQPAQRAHLPYVINETNNYCSGGMPGVSTTFASALWGTDFLFTALEQGAAGVNLQGVPNDAGGNWPPHLNYYSPINSDGSATPLYYAMLLFHEAAATGRVSPVTLTPSGSSRLNVSAHASVGADSRLRIILINKDLTHSARVRLDTSRSYGAASVIWLRAPAITATTSVTLGGSPVASDGGWSPARGQPLAVVGPLSTIALPAGSAAVITYAPH